MTLLPPVNPTLSIAKIVYPFPLISEDYTAIKTLL